MSKVTTIPIDIKYLSLYTLKKHINHYVRILIKITPHSNALDSQDEFGTQLLNATGPSRATCKANCCCRTMPDDFEQPPHPPANSNDTEPSVCRKQEVFSLLK